MISLAFYLLVGIIAFLIMVVLLLIFRRNGFLLSLSSAGAMCAAMCIRLFGPSFSGKMTVNNNWFTLNLDVAIGQTEIAAYILTGAMFYIFSMAMQLYAKHEELKLRYR